MIVPDDKDWTWVLDRSCPDCGFDASTCAANAVPELVRGNALRWQQLLEDGAIHPGRRDASAISDRYEEQDPTVVVDQLITAAEALAIRLEGVSPSDQHRPGRRSDGARFTVDSIARYMVHDPIHHMWDVTRPGG